LKKIGFFFLSIVIFIYVYQQAEAYVLQGSHLLELMTQNLGKSKRLLISQKLILYDNSRQGGLEFNETLKYIFPETFRSDIISESVQRIHVLSKGEALTVIDGKAVAASEALYDRYKDIFLYNSRILLEDKLYLHGVDVDVSSLGRFQGRPVYVLGAQYPDETVPQIWLTKDTFRPLRWILTGKTAANREDALEVRYLDWQLLNKMWYPMRVEFYRDDILVREIRVQNIETKPAFSEDLFDIDHLKSIYLPDASQRSEQDAEKDLNEVQKTIEEFKKMYE
jgi:outer membrane lipoprotein-sorting protein